ncbi:MAG: type IV pilus assembly protein PilB [Candidatus Paceibacteria bacterium]|jgi:type IV pilus assembly protein PilB
MRFLQTLIDNKILTDSSAKKILELAADKHGGDIEVALLSSGIDQKEILKAKSSYYNFPSYEIGETAPADNVLKFISKDSAEHYKIVPLEFTDNSLSVGVLDPSNAEAADALQFIATKNNISFKLFLIGKGDYDRVMDAYQGISAAVGQAIDDFQTETDDEKAVSDSIQEVAKAVSSENTDGDDKKSAVKEDAPIIKIVAVIIRHAIEGGASDIHIENTGSQVKVRFRVDGVLHTSLMLPKKVYSGVVARIKILSKLRLDEKRKPQDGSFSAKIDSRKIDFRVSTMPSSNGEKIVIRILDKEKGVKSLEDIGFSDEHAKTLRKAIKQPHGLILITGPTGSGKSTTIYALLQELDREGKNVVSLEDPVEYNIDNVSQSQVMPEIGYTFASGLRSILRQDPDIIMVGEIRDKETAKLAIQAALTGHLVLSTLHTNSSIGVVPRLIDMDVDPYLIAPTLTLAVAQRLVKRVCSDAREEVPIDESTKEMIQKEIQDLPENLKQEFLNKKTMYKINETPSCPGGTKGRIAVCEMFEIDSDVERVILSKPNEQDIFKVVREKGMKTIKEDGIIKALDGKIPMQEVFTL